MNEVETSFIETHQTKPLVWFRYIDDVLFIWTHGQGKLEELNRCNPYIKFTDELSKTSIPFLDLKVTLPNGGLSTDVNIKFTDRHQVLHYTLSHPDHTNRSIIYSQALRISRYALTNLTF